MFMKWPVTYVCAFAYLLNDVNAKICEETELVTTMVEETFRTSFIETYHGQCPYGCIKTRWATSVGRRYVPKREWKTAKFCCVGYWEIISDLNDTSDAFTERDIVCEPICAPCKHGYCKAPSECACNTGYIPDPTDDHNCIPSCVGGCEHGTCVAPDTCQCDTGYKLVNTTCQPVCSSQEPCQNGTCIAPETCECLPGYRKSRQNICEPYCSKGCDNGLCVEPETCLCNPGWQFKESKDGQNGRCEPICSKPCANGICVAPDTCGCMDAYKKSTSGICEPVCMPPCGNGTCIAPQTCSCFPGYHVGTDDIYSLLDSPRLRGCIPTCSGCRDIHCIAPEKCYPEILRTERHSPDRFFDDYDMYDDYYSGIFDDSYIDTKKTLTTKTIRSDDTITESIKHPFHTSTRLDATDTDIMEYSYGTSTADDVNTEEIKNSVDKITHSDDKIKESMNKSLAESTKSYDTNTVTGSMKNPNNGSTHSEDAQRQSMSWLQHHWVSIFIPVLVIVTAAAIMLLVWRWAPIIVFFKGRSYVVEGDPAEINGSRTFEDIQISAINEKEKTAEK